MPAKKKPEQIFSSRVNPIGGRNNQATIKRARKFYKQWKKECSGIKAKRRPYVKITILKRGRQQNRKIFIDMFEAHLHSKNIGDVARRMKLLPCVKDLLEDRDEMPHMEGDICQFIGKTPGGEIFEVVIKEDKKKLYLFTFYPIRPERKNPHH